MFLKEVLEEIKNLNESTLEYSKTKYYPAFFSTYNRW